jgi:rod shape-determining protein MreD
VRRALISCAVILVALIAQLTIINRLALPGGDGPDLVLLGVVALALTGGPVPGMVTGFLAGLALDVAPPASHTIGQYALVFCLVGYVCGRLAALGEASPGLYVAISAGAAAVGAALSAALGVLLSDPQVTWSAVRHVLPPSLVYDVILSPFVLYAVVRLSAWAARSGAGREGADLAGPLPAGWLAGAAASATGAIRQTGAAGTPRLRLGGGRSGDGRIGAAGALGAAWLASGQRPTGKHEPKLHLGGARKAGGAAAGLTGGQRPPARREPKLRFAGGRTVAGQRPAARREPKLRFAGGRTVAGHGPAARREPKLRFAGGRTVAGQRPAARREPKLRFGGAGTAGGAAAAARAQRGTAGSRSAPKMRFGNGRRRDGLVGGAGAPARRGGAVPRFRKRRVTGTIGTGGSVGRARGAAFGRRSAPRLRMRRGTVRSKVWRLVGRGTGGYR